MQLADIPSSLSLSKRSWMRVEALKNVQQLVRSGISGWESMESAFSSLDIFSLTINLFFFQVTHEQAMQCEQLVKKLAQWATSSSRCASIQMSSLQVLWEKPNYPLTWTQNIFKSTKWSSRLSPFQGISFPQAESEAMELQEQLLREAASFIITHQIPGFVRQSTSCILASCNGHPRRCCGTTSPKGFACLWTGGLVLPFQRDTTGWSFSQTGSSPERHQSPVSWTCDQSHQPAWICGKPEAYNGVFNIQ